MKDPLDIAQGVDYHMLSAVRGLFRIPEGPGEGTSAYLYRLGTQMLDTRLPINLRQIVVSHSQLPVMGDLAFKGVASKPLLATLQMQENGTVWLFQDAHLRGAQGLVLMVMVPMNQVSQYSRWLERMPSPRMIVASAKYNDNVIIGFPLVGFFK